MKEVSGGRKQLGGNTPQTWRRKHLKKLIMKIKFVSSRIL